ncbi:MAG TPA: patatin-like phospholipase family protein [Chloroflexota bacterium]|nr:patatin-like phospholipase family protein [Chloroflexota bacterium]
MQPHDVPALFQGLPAAALAALLAGVRRRRFSPGETVVAEGAGSEELFVVRRGTASLSVGGGRDLGLIGPGETAGETALFAGQPSPATVRALTELEVLVLGGAELRTAVATHPTLYRNVAAILSQRLASAARRPASAGVGQVTILEDGGAPPLLAYALACSVAWHTRRPTVLLVLTHGEVPAPLAALATAAPPAPVALGGAGGAHLLLVSPPLSGLGSLPGLLARLRERYEHVLVSRARGAMEPLAADRTVALSGIGASGADTPERGTDSEGRPGHTVRGWSGAGRWPRPGADGVLHVPSLRPADEDALRRGMLPVGTPAGTALGWAARDLAGLKVGLAFGAGGARGFAHVGVLRSLERMGVSADYVAGTSIGAAVGALYAMGHDPDGIRETLLEVAASALRIGPRSTGLLSNSALTERLRAIGGGTCLESLRVPLGVVAADLASRREVVFRSGPTWSAVLASMSVPGLFEARCIGPYVLVDGAVLNPVPGDVVSEMGADRVVAVKLSSGPGRTMAEIQTGAPPAHASARPPSALEAMTRTIELMQSTAAGDSHGASVVIEPDFRNAPGVSLRRFADGLRYAELGHAAAEAAMPQLLSALPWLSGAAARAATCS